MPESGRVKGPKFMQLRCPAKSVRTNAVQKKNECIMMVHL